MERYNANMTDSQDGFAVGDRVSIIGHFGKYEITAIKQGRTIWYAELTPKSTGAKMGRTPALYRLKLHPKKKGK